MKYTCSYTLFYRASDALTRSCTTFEIVSSNRTAQTAVYRTTSSFSKTRTQLSSPTLYLAYRHLQITARHVQMQHQGRCTTDSEFSKLVELLRSLSLLVHVGSRFACSAMISLCSWTEAAPGIYVHLARVSKIEEVNLYAFNAVSKVKTHCLASPLLPYKTRRINTNLTSAVGHGWGSGPAPPL